MGSGVVYQIASEATKRVYIGSTARRPRQRWLEHLHYLRADKHHSRHLQRVFNKYGEGDLSFAIIEEVSFADHRELLAVEQKRIDECEAVIFNSQPVSDSIIAAQNAWRGKKHSDATRRKMSASHKASTVPQRVWTEDDRKNHSVALTGRKMPPVSDGARQNISIMQRYFAALRGEKVAETFDRYAFIKTDLHMWLDMVAKGMSYREIEKVTGRARLVIARECKRALA